MRAAGDLARRRASPSGDALVGPGLIEAVCYWAAVRCPPQREIVIAGRLEELGCSIYLPRARMILRRSLQPATVPLYATYLFADVDQGPPWQAIRRQPGVISIVMTGDTPSRCPESEILKLKAAEVDGVVRLASATSPSRYRPSVGEQVRIRFGPLDGREGRYAGPRRNLAQVLVTLLGRQVVVLVAADAIEAKAG